MRVFFGFVSLCCVALAPSVARAQAPLINGLGGPAGYGAAANCLGRNDDQSSGSIPIAAAFPMGVNFFGSTRTNMFVNTNGNITFGGQVGNYTASPFPVANQPMIAPFWADADTRRYGSGTGDMRTCAAGDGSNGATGTAPACHVSSAADAMNGNTVWWSVQSGATPRVIVTWQRVGYFSCHQGDGASDKRMSFQLILTPAAMDACTRPGDFDVEFRFANDPVTGQCAGWESGDASGGANGFPTSTAGCFGCIDMVLGMATGQHCVNNRCTGTAAQSGFDAGNRRDFVMIEGSRDPGIAAKLCTQSNVSMPGVWRFQIRNGGVVCPDAGQACTTTMPGVCAMGRTQCVGAGRPCVPVVPSSAERCDNLDNDCDGEVDDGDLCPGRKVCVRGACVDACFEGGCNTGQTCNAESLCVDDACASMTCPAGQRCAAGQCVGACDGIVCPVGQQCRAGVCVAPCAGVTCQAPNVCQDGVCVPTCPCRPCPNGQACQPNGVCVEAACDGTTCGAGTLCRGGQCVDPCAGAVCPSGETCTGGRCEPLVPEPDAGTPVGEPDAGDVSPGDDAGSSSTPDGGTTGAMDAGPGSPRPRPRTGGCGCHTVDTGGAREAAWLLGIGLAFVVRARRRRFS